MVTRILAFLVVFTLALPSLGQDQTKRAYRPDIPGNFLIDIGVNGAIGETPENFDYEFWGSRTVNLYYQKSFRLFKTKFSLNAGAGLSLERFKFKNNATLAPDPDADGSYPIVDAGTIYPGTNKSSLVMNYFDVPIELRFDTRPEDITRSFNVAVGLRGGALIDSFTKIRYSVDDETRKIKDKQNHGVNPFRYGWYSRLGIAGFNVFLFYNITPLFEDGKGPEQTVMSTFTAGISINGF